MSRTKAKNELADDGMDVENVRQRVRNARDAAEICVRLDGDDFITYKIGVFVGVCVDIPVEKWQ